MASPRTRAIGIADNHITKSYLCGPPRWNKAEPVFNQTRRARTALNSPSHKAIATGGSSRRGIHDGPCALTTNRR
jgi:hypothetical protein